MKMKRSKSEIINATVESYLKRRHYQQGGEYLCKSDQSVCQTGDEMTLSATVKLGISRDNSIVFSAITIDTAAADQAFERLKTWVNVILNDNIKTELRGLLYPVFCHLYLEMLHAGNKQAAVQFLKSHQDDFISETEKSFLEELSGVFSIQDIELRPLVNAFRTRKYKVDISDVAHVCLQQFLKKHGHITLMQIINTHITIIKKVDSISIDTDSNESKGQRSEIGINGHVEQPCGTGVDREMRELQEAIRLMQNNTWQPLRMFTVNNAIENASCGIVASNLDKVAVGFSTAEVRLWGTSETVLVKPDFREPSVTLARNVPLSNKWSENNLFKDEAGAIVLRGHTDVIHDMRFIPSPDLLLTVSSDKNMRVWRLQDYTCAAIYNGHNYPIWCMDTSIFNLYIATGSHDRTAKLWSLDRKFPLRIFAGHFLDVNSIKFHPNARYLATGSADKTIRLWDKDDASLLRVYVGAQSTIYSLAFSPNGKYLAAAGDDKSIAIWDLATSSLLTELKGHQDTIINVDWSLDGQYIASASADGIVRLWSTQDNILVSNSGSKTTSSSKTDNFQTYSTYCSSILSLRYYKKNNTLICIGTT